VFDWPSSVDDDDIVFVATNQNPEFMIKEYNQY